MTKEFWFDYLKGKMILLFSMTSRPALGPTSPLCNGYWGFFPRGKEAGSEADHSPPSSAEVLNSEAPVSHKFSRRGT